MKESTLLAISAPIAVEILRAIKVDNIVRRSAVGMTKTTSVPLVGQSFNKPSLSLCNLALVRAPVM